MTTQQKLQAITTDIRAKLPRLMELEEGCILSLYDGVVEYIGKIVETIGGSQIADTGDYDDLCATILSKYNGIHYKNLTEDDYKIIGQEPMLNDVLEWLFLVNRGESIFDASGNLLTYFEEFTEKHVTFIESDDISWDLSKLYLKDQESPLINYLYKILKQEIK